MQRKPSTLTTGRYTLWQGRPKNPAHKRGAFQGKVLGKPTHMRKNSILKRDVAIAVITSRFNSDITENMQKGAVNELRTAGIKNSQIKIVHVSGSFELPLACQRLARSGEYDGLIAIGCVIKGETDHYYHIARETSHGIMEVMLKYNIPIGFGVITVDTIEQALKRSTKHNKGREAARAVLDILATFSSEQDIH